MVNYIIITAARCAPSRQTALSQYLFSSDLMERQEPCGAVVASQCRICQAHLCLCRCETLSGFEKAVDLMPQSSLYGHDQSSWCGRIYQEYHESDAHQLYRKCCGGKISGSNPSHASKGMSSNEFGEVLYSIFANSGALTMRLGRIMTGSNPGGYMLGVSYPSLATVEATYDRLGADASFAAFSNKIDINMRSIIRLHG